MYDFSWSDPLSWIAIGVPVVIFASVVIGIWELIKWIVS
jgi:hypothetical protein